MEPWPGGSPDIKEGSRHYLRVEGKLLSGWVTFASPEGVLNFAKNDDDATDAASAPPSAPAEPTGGAAAEPSVAAAAASPGASKDKDKASRRSSASPQKKGAAMPMVVEAADEDGEEEAPAPAPSAAEEEAPIEGIWTPIRKKIGMHSGSDPNNSEKIGTLNERTPVRILQQRTTELGVRVYVSTIPNKSNVLLTMALNEFNHSPQRFPSVAEYEAARVNYCEDIVVREAMVEDAITGNQLRIKDQTLYISTATDAVDNARPIPAEWHVHNVLDLVRLLLVPSPNRANGSHSTQPVLVRAGPGTGKTWMAKQAVFTLADRLLRGTTGGASAWAAALEPVPASQPPPQHTGTRPTVGVAPSNSLPLPPLRPCALAPHSGTVKLTPLLAAGAAPRRPRALRAGGWVGGEGRRQDGWDPARANRGLCAARHLPATRGNTLARACYWATRRVVVCYPTGLVGYWNASGRR